MTRCSGSMCHAESMSSAVPADPTVLPLRYPKLWFGLGWLMLIAVTVGSLMPGMDGLDVDTHDKFIHFSSYFALMLWFAGLYQRRRHYALIAAILMALGVFLDALQGQLPYRQFDMLDIAANTAGVICGFGLAVLMMGGWCQRVERWLAD